MRRQWTAWCEAPAHLGRQRFHRQAPLPQPKVIYQLGMEVERRGAECEGRKQGTGGQHVGNQRSGPQGEDTKARQSTPGTHRGGISRHPEGRMTAGGEGQQGEGDSA